jgi:LDH2 family malate/lactate/ureidoglycolate dehydrogenase
MKSHYINTSECYAFIKRILDYLGAKPDHAHRWSEILIEASLLGIDSHGIRMLPRYIKHIEGGGIDLLTEPVVISDSGACVTMDGQAGLGHIAADHVTDMAIEKAKLHGISCVTIKNCNHVGACAIYARKVALENCIGICGAVSIPGMAPWGGKTALIGLNPIAISAPIDSKHPFVIDIATTLTSKGKVTRAADLNQTIPDNWALDADGFPTTDPQRAIHGSLLPFGDYKGYGLAMGIEILTALLSGGALSPQINSWIHQTKESMGVNFTMIVIDISKFQDPDNFKKRMLDWTNLLINSPKREGVNRIYYSGERGGEVYDLRRKSGIPIDSQTAKIFTNLADRFKIKRPIFKENNL